MKAENALGLAKYKNLMKLIKKVQKKQSCVVDFPEDETEVQCHITADQLSYKIMNSYIAWKARRRFILGLIIGTLLGVFLAYVIIPSFSTYKYTSDRNLLPPEYDLLFKSKEPHEQVMQILTHNAEPQKEKRGGPYKEKQAVYRAQINDSSRIELWYALGKKSLIMNIGQKKGEEIIKAQIEKSMASTGIDSAAQYYVGIENSHVSGDVADAVSRTSAMQIEQGYLSLPVIRIIIESDKNKRVYTNFLRAADQHHNDFAIQDSDSDKKLSKDNTKNGRKTSVPTLDDEADYKLLVNEFITNFIEDKSIK